MKKNLTKLQRQHLYKPAIEPANHGYRDTSDPEATDRRRRIEKMLEKDESTRDPWDE